MSLYPAAMDAARRPIARTPLLIAAAMIGLGLASQLEIPLNPVPITLQSLAVVLVGFALGPAKAFVATLCWIVLGGAGLPLFAGGEGGSDHLTGPTAGYLFAFPLAAALAGAIGRLGRPSALAAFVLAVAAHVLILALGGSFLATHFGAAAAWEKGVLPFLLGGLIKSGVAAAIYSVAARPGR